MILSTHLHTISDTTINSGGESLHYEMSKTFEPLQRIDGMNRPFFFEAVFDQLICIVTAPQFICE